MSDPSRLTATEAARRIAAGTLRPEALMEACLDRVAAREGTVRAFAWLDAALARRSAAAARPGPLHGLPVGVKDVIDTADMPTQMNSPVWAGWRPRADAACVIATRAAGGVVMGKTVTTEFATRHPGPTANPHGTGRTPGGSSSGSAAGVADFFFPLAFGTQTAGSIIRPAAYCGAVGYKPSYGTISRMGMKIMSDSLDTMGVMARSVEDCALFAGAISDRELSAPHPATAPRIGICRSPSWSAAAPETQALLERAAGVLVKAGAVVSDRELPADFAELTEAHPVVMNAESAWSIGWELDTAPAQVTPVLRERMAWGRAQGAEQLDRARSVFARTQVAFPAAMEGLDILVTPSAPGEAPEGLGWTGDPAFNFLWTSLHVPCVTVPAGTGPNGMPLGIQIVGRKGEDRAVLAWAGWVARALG